MSESDGKPITPWKNGRYTAKSYPSMFWHVDGEEFITYPASGKPTKHDDPMYKGTIKYGDFGETSPEVEKESGKKRCNVEITAWGGTWKQPAVLSDDGTKFTYYGMTRSVDTLDWMSEEEVAEFLASGDPEDAIPHPYKIQPENQGKLLWLSGAPGLGKSTSGMLLARNFEYVYYEADAFMNHINPYTPTDVDEPTLATFTQKFLKGVSQDRIDTVATAMLDFMALIEGKEYDFDQLGKFYSLMANDIAREQKRIGGDFAVAHAVPTRKVRDHIRKELGSNLIFVVLHMSKEDQLARIKNRHGDEQMFIDMLSNSYKVFEPATEDEPNAIAVDITKDMSRDDVVNKIIQSVKNYEKNGK